MERLGGGEEADWLELTRTWACQLGTVVHAYNLSTLCHEFEASLHYIVRLCLKKPKCKEKKDDLG